MSQLGTSTAPKFATIEEVKAKIEVQVLKNYSQEQIDDMSYDRFSRREASQYIERQVSDQFLREEICHNCNEYLLRVIVSEILLAHHNRVMRQQLSVLVAV